MTANENRPEAAILEAASDKHNDGLSLRDQTPSEAFLVLVVTPLGRERRRPYLSLHSATQAVQRARAKGQPAGMVLCRLVPCPLLEGGL